MLESLDEKEKVDKSVENTSAEYKLICDKLNVYFTRTF